MKSIYAGAISSIAAMALVSSRESFHDVGIEILVVQLPEFSRATGMAPSLGMEFLTDIPRADRLASYRSGGQQKSRDVVAGRAAEKRARKARAVTRRNGK